MNPCSNQLQNYFILEIHDFGFKLAIILAEDGDIYNLFKNSRVNGLWRRFQSSLKLD